MISSLFSKGTIKFKKSDLWSQAFSKLEKGSSQSSLTAWFWQSALEGSTERKLEFPPAFKDKSWWSRLTILPRSKRRSRKTKLGWLKEITRYEYSGLDGTWDTWGADVKLLKRLSQVSKEHKRWTYRKKEPMITSRSSRNIWYLTPICSIFFVNWVLQFYMLEI